jgi:hypothetical protein
MSNSQAPPADERYSCLSSMAADEPIWAHATRVDTWLALGYEGAWGRKALPESDLPAKVKDHLLAFEKAGPNRRVQFIKRSQPSPADEIPLLVARCDQASPDLRQVNLASYQQLLDIDLSALLLQPAPAEQRVPPTFLICTNGRRDLCCARFGMDVYRSFADLAPNRAWRTTHLGGHRFSPTAVLLPYGLHYGRLRQQDAGDLLALTDAGRLSLPHLRGRTSFPPPAQAAEHYLRQQKRLDRIDALRLLGVRQSAPAEWLVEFELADGGGYASLVVSERRQAYRVIKTTGDAERSWVSHFEVAMAD